MVKKNQKRTPASLQPWIDARAGSTCRMSTCRWHVNLDNPKKLGKLDNHHKSYGSCLCRNSFGSFIEALW